MKKDMQFNTGFFCLRRGCDILRSAYNTANRNAAK